MNGPPTCDAMKLGDHRLFLRLLEPPCEVWQGGSYIGLPVYTDGDFCILSSWLILAQTLIEL
jgi:hypothetical protein